MWVTDFPLVEWNEEEKRWSTPRHHPFTSPREADWEILEKDPGRVRARAYDLVIDGYEAGGGSIRIHRSDRQQRMFSLLGLAARRRGAPLRLVRRRARVRRPAARRDRARRRPLVMLMLGEDAIQEVIAFPKTAQARDLLTRAPAPVDEKQLREASIAIVPPPAKAPQGP